MIDLHCHLLPGLDDGPATLDESIALARVARTAGIEATVATPHIREDYPFDPALIRARARELQQALDDAGIGLRVIEGAEIAISRVRDLTNETLRALCIDGGPYMLVESPYTHATTVLEETIFDLQVQGFRPVLAHPERCPSFQQDSERLARLVERGVLCSVTAASMMGTFGGIVSKFTSQLFAERLVHNVASDAHDPVRRSVDLRGAFEALGLVEHAQWFTADVPEAIVHGRELPPMPAPSRGRRKGWRRWRRPA